MPSLCLYFQVHQPIRLRRYTFFDIGKSSEYADQASNRSILKRVSGKCYLPAASLLHRLIRSHHGKFRLAFSLSGTVLDQLEQSAPEVIHAFQRLARTGCVEFLNETYYHSLACVYSPDEFAAQVQQHRERIHKLFGQYATTFRNTELIYRDALVREVANLGYRVILAEGAAPVLRRRSPDKVYRPSGCPGLRVPTRNCRFSDDIAFRFTGRNSHSSPLTAGLFAERLQRASRKAQVINLFMDFETFGEHQWAETGIMNFLRDLPAAVLALPGFCFQTPAEAAAAYPATATLKVPRFTSWADTERDLSAWLGNTMQRDAAKSLYEMEPAIRAASNPDLLHIWRLLQTSDHFYYMCTKHWSDGDVHKYFNPFPSPYDAYITYMNVLADLHSRIQLKAGRRDGTVSHGIRHYRRPKAVPPDEQD